VRQSRREPSLVLTPTRFPLAAVEIDKAQPLLLSAGLLVASCSLLE
jgi:hypothetical protein